MHLGLDKSKQKKRGTDDKWIMQIIQGPPNECLLDTLIVQGY